GAGWRGGVVPPTGVRAVPRNFWNSVAGGTCCGLQRVRSAATHPAATGQAADTPVSGTQHVTAFDPRKCVYATRSGLCSRTELGGNIPAITGPLEEYPTMRSFASQPPIVRTSG